MKLLLPGARAPHIRAFQDVPEVDEVVVSDIHPWSYATFVADRSFLLPPFQDAGFLPELVELYGRERCDVCLPIHDGALALLSRHRDMLSASSVRLAMNNATTVDIVSDKWEVHRFFVDHEVPTPPTWLWEEYVYAVRSPLPAFVKQRFIDMRGTEESLYVRLEDRDDVDYFARKLRGRGERYVVQPLIEGVEVNVDFFCDARGAIKSMVAVTREAATGSGAIARGGITSPEPLAEFVHHIGDHLRFWGANQVQAFLVDGQTLFTDINARLSGSSVFVRAAGVDYFRYLVKLIRGEPVEIHEQPARLRMATWESPFFYAEPRAVDIERPDREGFTRG